MRKEKRRAALAIALLGSLLLYVVNALAQGFLGNFATTMLFPEVATILTMTQWPPFLLPALILATLGGGGLSWWIFHTKTEELVALQKTSTEEIETLQKTSQEELKQVTNIFENLILLDDLTFQWLRQMEKARSHSLNDLN